MIATPEKVIVSGANGFLGMLLLKRLFAKGASVTAIIHPLYRNNLEEVSKYSSDIVFTDFSDMDFLNRLPHHPTSFVHLAWAGVNGPEKGNIETQEKNIQCALFAAKAAASIDAAAFIGVGTISENAYLNCSSESLNSPSLIYGKYKHLCHMNLTNFFVGKKTRLVWLRLANLYGSTNRTGNILSYAIDELINGRTPIFGPCDQFYDFLLADDAVEAISRFALAGKPFQDTAYFIGSSKPRVLKDYLFPLAAIISPCAKIDIGRRPPDGLVFHISDFDCKNTMRDIGNYVSVGFEESIRSIVLSKIRAQ